MSVDIHISRKRDGYTLFSAQQMKYASLHSVRATYRKPRMPDLVRETLVFSCIYDVARRQNATR